MSREVGAISGGPLGNFTTPTPFDRQTGVNRVLGEETEADRMGQRKITEWNAYEHKTVEG